VIFHLLARQDWSGATEDAPVAVPGEHGYVRCCDEGQVAGVRQRWFPPGAEIVAVAFDPTRLPAETLYGALPRDQVAFVRRV